MKNQDKISFLVVGAQKSGTTAVDKYLRTNSDIEMAGTKEIHYFDDEDAFQNHEGYDAYHEKFLFAESKIRGEVTPIYMYWSPSMNRIYEYNPQMKILAILRNPIERAFSHWNMERDRGADNLGFSEAIRKESMRVKDVHPLQHRVYSYVDRGYYSEQINRIWSHFPVDQTLFIKHEELRCDPNKALKEISRFLGVSPFRHVYGHDVHSRTYVSELSDEDREFLSEAYSKEIGRVESMLGWDCSDWR